MSKKQKIRKEDKSPQVTQRNKVEIEINFKIQQFTESQKELIQKILNNDITFIYGPAGSSKTFTTCYTALRLLHEKKISQIIITKPIQESGEKLGFLPGSVDDKISPYLESFYSNIEKIIEKDSLKKLIEIEKIAPKPLAYMRGATFDNSIMVLDEAQNCDFRQLMLFISRMGVNTKVIIAGDISQYDIEENCVALTKFIKMVNNIRYVSVHEFKKNDIIRNKILIEITDRYEEWKRKNLTTSSKKNGNGYKN